MGPYQRSRLAGLQAALDCNACSSTEIRGAENELEKLPGPSHGTKLVTAPVKGRKSFICFDEDTTIKNINQAIDKGFDVPELIKRFTSAGTGPGQGGIPGHNLPLYVAYYQKLPDISIRSTIEWLRYHTRYDGWDFHTVNLTDSMGVINLSGPRKKSA